MTVPRIEQGGTGSDTALSNGKVIVSDSNKLVETTTTTAQINLLDPISSILTGTSDNDKLVTEGYGNDNWGGSSHLNQTQIFYAAKAGNDANDGKSIERPVLTSSALMSKVAAASPDPFTIIEARIIDGGTYNGNITVPDYCSFVAKSAIINGNITLGPGSSIDVYKIEGTITQNGIGASWCKINQAINSSGVIINQTNIGPLYTNINFINHSGGSNTIQNTTTSVMYLNFDKLSNTGGGNVISSTAGTIYLNGKMVENLSSSGSSIYLNGGKIKGYLGDNLVTGSANAVNIINSSEYELNSNKINGNIVSASSSKIRSNIDYINGDLDFATSCESYMDIKKHIGNISDDGSTKLKIKRKEDPLVVAYTNLTIPSVTGDGTLYPLKFSLTDINNGDLYNTVSGLFFPDIKGIYEANINLVLSGFDSNHVSAVCAVGIQGAPSKTRIYFQVNPYTIRSQIVSEKFALSGAVKFKLLASQTANLEIIVSDSSGFSGNKTINIENTSSFSISLVQSL